MVVGEAFGEKKAKSFHDQDKKIGGERASLSEPPFTLEEARRLSIDQNREVGAGNAGKDPLNEPASKTNRV